MKNNPLVPIPSTTKAEKVVERILDYFKAGALEPGDSIPHEKDLVEQLKVSRPIVREALSHLKMMGVIESKKKRGMLLKEPNMFQPLQQILLPNLLFEPTRQDIFELRLMLEVGIADSLFARINKKDIEVLESIIEGEATLLAKKKTPATIQKLVEQDASFHSKLYEITGNSILQSLQNLILPTIRYVINHQFKMDPLSYGSVSHAELVKLLKQGAVDPFRIAMRKHLELHFDKILTIDQKI